MFDEEKTPTFAASKDAQKPLVVDVVGQTVTEQLSTGVYVKTVIEDALDRGLFFFKMYVAAAALAIIAAVGIMTLYLSTRINDVANDSRAANEALATEVGRLKADVEQIKKEMRK